MGTFTKKLEGTFPVAEKCYRVCRNGIVKQLAELKNIGVGKGKDFPVPYVEEAAQYYEAHKNVMRKRLLLVTEDESLALKMALLIREKYKYFLEFEDELDDYDFDLWDEEEEETSEEKMLRIVSLKQSETPDKGEMNQYIARLADTAPETVVLFTGLTGEGDMNARLEAIGACPGEMQFIQISKTQLKEPWVQELRMEFYCGVLEIAELGAEYYERVMRFLLKGEEYTLSAELSAKLLVHKIQKSKRKGLKEEDLAWYLDDAVENAARNHPHNKSLQPKDFPGLFGGEKAPMRQLMEMVGMKSVKEMAKEFAAIVQEEMQNKSLGILHKNMIFLGNPGTGKTTCAELLANVMAEVGHTNARFVVASRKDLVGEYVGHTAPKVAAKFEEARGGILFVDEAGFFLNTDSGGYVQEAIKEFVRYMELYPDVTVIFAMYAKEAGAFLELDAGISSRISRFVNFEDYTDEELCLIARDMLKERGYILEKEAEGVVAEYMEQLRKDKKRSFGNAREARKLIESAIVAACVQRYSKASGGRSLKLSAGEADLKYGEMVVAKSADLKYGDKPVAKSAELKYGEMVVAKSAELKSGNKPVAESADLKYGEKPARKAAEKAAAKKQNNYITAEHIREGWRRLHQESVKKQEVFGFGSRQPQGKMLCNGQ